MQTHRVDFHVEASKIADGLAVVGQMDFQHAGGAPVAGIGGRVAAAEGEAKHDDEGEMQELHETGHCIW